MVSAPPWNMRTESKLIPAGDHAIEFRDAHNHLVILQSCLRLNPIGLGLFIVHPSFVSRGMRRNVYQGLPDLGLSLEAFVSLPEGQFQPMTSIGGGIALIGRGHQDRIFVGQISQDAERNRILFSNLWRRHTGEDLGLGALVHQDSFSGFQVLKEGELGARCRLSWLDAIDHEWLLRFLEHRIAGKTADFASVARTAVSRHDPRQEPGAVVPHAGICAGGPG